MLNQEHDFLHKFQDMDIIFRNFIEKQEASIADFKRQYYWWQARCEQKVEEKKHG